VGAARLPQVREWVAAADTAHCTALAQETLRAAAGRPQAGVAAP